MRKAYKTLRKFLILLTGLPIVILGIILIPLPGPGLLVTFLGLLLLSVEFEWAKKHTHRVKSELKKINDKAQARANKIQQK